MSHEGKMHRGEKWYRNRNQDGILPPDIKDDPNKMIDVDYFLKNSKKKEEPKSTGKK